jgi:hypothetical protein
MATRKNITVNSQPPKFVDTTPKKRGRPKGSTKLKVVETEQKKMKEAEVKPDASVVLDPLRLDEIQLPELQEWDPTSLPDGFFVVMEGKRRTGKSTFAKWLLQYYKDKFSLVWVMSQTSASGYWQKFVGSKFVFDSWNAKAIRRLFARNDKIIAKYGEESEIALKTGSVLLILDDCINQEIWSSNEFIKLAVEGRHHLLSVCYLTQDPKSIRPMIRDNADVAVVFNQKTFRNKESLWHDFMNDVDKKTALKLMATHCVDHKALICVQTNLDGDIQKNFFVSTGDKTKLEDPEYTLGGPTQKIMILKEREESKKQAVMAKIEEKGDKRPPHQKVEESLKADSFTTDKITKM